VTYPEDFENKIGFHRLREQLNLYCQGEHGKDLVQNISFSLSYSFIKESINQTNEYNNIYLYEEEVPVGHFTDIRQLLSKASVQGTYLELQDIVDLKRSIETVKSFVNYFRKKTNEEYHSLKKLSSEVSIFPFVLDSINRILNKQGKLKDNASPELAGIRKTILEKQSGINKHMSVVLKKAQKDGWIDHEASLSIRSGRMVIPVPSAYKRRLGGIVHDESATGKTSYIEPAEIVEVNNVVKELYYAEKREIIKILISFTDSIRPYINELEKGDEYIARMDFIQARAKLAISMEAVRPVITEKPHINWIGARHPILYLSYKKDGKKIVPLDIRLSSDKRILLISGPNAGGKSVCLKTVGLIQYMFQCGLMVPLEANSKLGIFDKIFIDIGDEQSIDNDLSTYSSHLINMKYFIKHANQKTLVLIDEFGTGTEPMLGGSLAESILSELNKNKSFGVITTHYSNLKHFASSAEGIINGAMLFDSNKMLPLFELSIGKPGSSFAFEIAKKIGFSEDILNTAAERVGEEHINFDKHLRDIERDKRYWGRKRQNIRKAEKKIEELVELYSNKMDELDKQTKEILKEAQGEADTVLSGANKLIENTIRKIRESQAEKVKTKAARSEMHSTGEKLIKKTEEDAQILKKIQKIKEKEKNVREKYSIKPGAEKNKVVEKLVTPISIGDKVMLIGQEVYGEVLEINDNTAVVMIGDMKTSLKKERLRRVSNNEYKQNTVRDIQIQKPEMYDVGKTRMDFNPNIDVRGLRADEALQKVADFIDESIMLNVTEIRILHGKGNGILRQLIREFIHGIDLIKEYNDEDIRFGGSGITIIKF